MNTFGFTARRYVCSDLWEKLFYGAHDYETGPCVNRGLSLLDQNGWDAKAVIGSNLINCQR